MPKIGEISETVEVEWEIKSSDVLNVAVGTKFVSPKFHFAGDQWFLKIYPNGEDKKCGPGTLGCYLEPRDKKQRTSIDFEISLSCFGISHCKHEASYVFSKENDDWGWSTFLNDFQNLISSQDQFKICCKMKKTSINENGAVCEDKRDLVSDLSKNLLYVNSCSDVLLKPRNGEGIPAHRCLLMARSDVFQRMFSTDMTESKENVVEISDLDRGVLAELLEFIYTDNCEFEFCSAEDLLVAADKYMMDNLKKFCVRNLLTTMNTENVIPRLFISVNNNAPELKAGAFKFIGNNLRLVHATSHWASLFQEPALAVEVSNMLVSLAR